MEGRMPMSNGSWWTLVGVILGGTLTFAVQIILELIRDARKTEQLSHAIAGEISALLELVAARQYVEAIDEHLRLATQGSGSILNVHIEKNYFSVIEANLQNIGMLPVELPLLVPRFLTLSKSVLEDIDALNKGVWESAGPEDLVRMYDGLAHVIKAAIKTGHQIVALIATLYGSPHGRYPIGVRLRMIGWKFRKGRPESASD
jgi:hypothetical protein